jgi:hypothetical protein
MPKCVFLGIICQRIGPVIDEDRERYAAQSTVMSSNSLYSVMKKNLQDQSNDYFAS